jgi:hypothetical protein
MRPGEASSATPRSYPRAWGDPNSAAGSGAGRGAARLPPRGLGKGRYAIRVPKGQGPILRAGLPGRVGSPVR